MNKIAIIVAGGTGTRMQTDMPKQFLPLLGEPVILHTIKAFMTAYEDMQIIIVLPKEHLSYGASILKELPNLQNIHLIQGGSTRYSSVKNGLAAISTTQPDHCIVFVHDGVRCLVTTKLIKRCFEQASLSGTAIPACPATDSMRIVDKLHPEKSKSIARENIRLIQTPQTFKYSLLKQAFDQPFQESFTDEASVLEALGKDVSLVEGDSENIKLTRPTDLIIAEAILNQRLRLKAF